MTVRRRFGGGGASFGVRVEFCLPDDQKGWYAFEIGAVVGGGCEVRREVCVIGGPGKSKRRFFHIEKGRLLNQLLKSSERAFPAVTADRLALVAASGFVTFRPVFDALSTLGVYNLDPKVMRALQKPHNGEPLKCSGDNLASVIGHLERFAPERLAIIKEYLRVMAPTVYDVERRAIGHMETLAFCQDMEGVERSWIFHAHHMSDGVLRALGVLVALLQRGAHHAPGLIGIESPDATLSPRAVAALREALIRAMRHSQVLVVSPGVELLDDDSVGADVILSAVLEKGETRIAPLDESAREWLRDHRRRGGTVGELLRRDQLRPDMSAVERGAGLCDLFEDRGDQQQRRRGGGAAARGVPDTPVEGE